MKVGDLVTVGPSFKGAYIVVSLSAVDPHTDDFLPGCVVLAVPDRGSIAMHRKWLRMVSEA